MKNYRLKILTPEKCVFDADITALTVTGDDGQLSVLAGHAPMTATLSEGVLIVRSDETESQEGVVGSGVLWVADNEAVVMVHAFRWSGDEAAETTPANKLAVEDSLF